MVKCPENCQIFLEGVTEFLFSIPVAALSRPTPLIKKVQQQMSDVLKDSNQQNVEHYVGAKEFPGEGSPSLGFLLFAHLSKHERPPTMTVQTNIAGGYFYEIIV